MNTQCGEWTHKKILGQGGFGQVSLWEHPTEEPIAIKMCKQMLVNKTLRRWESEVEHMCSLDHPNIVKSSVIPEAIKNRFIGGYPALGMEYCEAGDLRRHLSLPVNCCGLPENKIIDLLGSIGSAVNYLHQKNITHRDLKPENIVLKQTSVNKFVFKIIDLGYAKDLNEQSCGYSFVGTYHYLAPEFFLEPIRYTNTVDYWSLGLVAFECITGRRPFYPESIHILRFLTELKKDKKDHHICTERTAGSGSGTQATFSSTIPQPHALNNLFEERITVWLQKMVRFDPKTRGGSNSNNYSWNDELQDILNDKYIHVYNTLSGKVLTILADNKMRLNTLKQKVFQLTEVPVCEQLLLFFDGNKLDCQKKLIDTCCRPESDGNGMLYLYAYQGSYHHTFLSFPTEIQMLLAEPKKSLSYKQAVLTLCLTTNFTKICFTSAISSIGSVIAICYSVGKHQDYFKNNYIGLSNLFHRFIGKLELFESGLNTDIQFYEKYERDIYEDEEMLEQWLCVREEIKTWKDNDLVPIEITLRQVQELLQESNVVKKIIEESNSHRHKLIEGKKISEAKHKEVLIAMKRIEQSSNPNNPSEMVKGLHALIKHLNSIVIEYIKKVNAEAISWNMKLVKFHNDMQQLTPQMIGQRDTLIDLTNKMQRYQEQRQTSLWEGILNLKVHGNKKEQLLGQILNSIPPDANLSQEMKNINAGMKIFGDIANELNASLNDSLLDDWDFLKDSDVDAGLLSAEFKNVATVDVDDNTITTQQSRPVENQSDKITDNDVEPVVS